MAKNQLKDILNQIKIDVREVVDNEVTDAIKDVYRDEVKFMYDEYEPLSYERRYDDEGFGDESKWKTESDLKGNTVYFELKNEAKAVNSTMRLDKIIEEGIYDTVVSPGERPVYERTSQRLESDRVVENGLSMGLKARGYKMVKK